MKCSRNNMPHKTHEYNAKNDVMLEFLHFFQTVKTTERCRTSSINSSDFTQLKAPRQTIRKNVRLDWTVCYLVPLQNVSVSQWNSCKRILEHERTWKIFPFDEKRWIRQGEKTNYWSFFKHLKMFERANLQVFTLLFWFLVNNKLNDHDRSAAITMATVSSGPIQLVLISCMWWNWFCCPRQYQ